MKKPNHCTLVISLLILAGCASGPPTPSIDIGALESQAAGHEAGGNLGAAAETYAQLAAAVTGERRTAYLLESARLEIELGDHPTAVLRIEEAGLAANPAQSQMIAVLTARIALAEGRHEDALVGLAGMGAPLSTELLVAAALIRGRALFATGQLVAAVQTFVEREVWLDESAQILANQRMIWDGLKSAGPATTLVETGDPVVDGWLALVPMAASVQTELELRRELLQWRIEHPTHPAARALLGDLLLTQRSATAFPTRIALLLPLSSTAREEALAIQDGFLAAHLASPGDHSTRIRVYDTGRDGGGAAYLRAQLDGADFIVGPLLRGQVDEVVEHAGFIPTLALNVTQLPTPAPINFYQFALAPEDEARAVARRAVATGALRAVAMMPSDEYGNRVFNSFRSEYEALGGRVLAAMPYEPAMQDYSTRITSLMNIDRSYQRQRRLAANLGIDLAFEPRRRQDIDMIFLYADAESGHLLAPQLEYYYAGDVPAYATSDIYDLAREGSNGDLNGVIFPDVPWLIAPDRTTAEIRRVMEQHWPQRSVSVPRFYGMGLDAYGFVAKIYRGEPLTTVAGASGVLSSDADGRIYRELPFAQFRNGRPEPLPPVSEDTRLTLSDEVLSPDVGDSGRGDSLAQR
jgi:outer membrane PBP1 activator LpoA protein